MEATASRCARQRDVRSRRVTAVVHFTRCLSSVVLLCNDSDHPTCKGPFIETYKESARWTKPTATPVRAAPCSAISSYGGNKEKGPVHPFAPWTWRTPSSQQAAGTSADVSAWKRRLERPRTAMLQEGRVYHGWVQRLAVVLGTVTS